MLTHLIAAVSLAVLCGAWVLVQHFIAGGDPEAPGVEGQTGCCGKRCGDARAGSGDEPRLISIDS